MRYEKEFTFYGLPVLAVVSNCGIKGRVAIEKAEVTTNGMLVESFFSQNIIDEIYDKIYNEMILILGEGE